MSLTINDCPLNYMVRHIIIYTIITLIIIKLRSFIGYSFKSATYTAINFHNLNILHLFSVKEYTIHWVRVKIYI